MPDPSTNPQANITPLSLGEELGLLRQSRKFPNDFQTEEVLTKFGLLNEKTLVAAIDLELTCWESPKGERTGYSEIQEVIEIGVVLADLSGKEIGEGMPTIADALSEGERKAKEIIDADG